MSDRFVSHDARFVAVVGRTPRLTKVVDGDLHEGPVYVADDDALFVTTRPRRGQASTIVRIGLDGTDLCAHERVRALVTDATMPNGMTLDRDGFLVVCEQGDLTHDACISRIDPRSAARTVVVDHWRGRRLNSPNDVAVAPDGAIWFTDPSYGHLQGFRPEPELGDFVYRWDPSTGRADVVADGFDKPNGIALSPDGATLYVTDSGADRGLGDGTIVVTRPHHVLAFDVVGGRRLTSRRLLAVTSPGTPDGLKVDIDGRVYVSSTSGVLVFDPHGSLLGEIAVPGTVNFTFGGRDGNVLFVTADSAVWAAELATTGPLPFLRGASR
jgi:gluconolactonase